MMAGRPFPSEDKATGTVTLTISPESATPVKGDRISFRGPGGEWGAGVITAVREPERGRWVLTIAPEEAE